MAIVTKGSGGSIKFSGTGGGISITSSGGGGGGGGGGVITSGLILHLDAGNPASYPGSGTTWYDISGNANNAIASSAPNSPTHVATNGGGFNFNSQADNFITSPNLRESYASGLTVAAWVKADVIRPGDAATIIGRTDWNSSHGWALAQHWNNTIMGPRYNAATSDNFAVTTNVVYYVAFTIDTSGNAKVYINGAQNGSTSTNVTLPTAASGSPTIGNYQGNDYHWQGDIYQIHMYNRDLTSSEMLNNFNNTKNRYGL